MKYFRCQVSNVSCQMSHKYTPTIGLEVHSELKTASKMFCGCRNDAEEKRPNVNVCPVCLGHPGTLPVPNAAAIEAILRVGFALGGKLPEVSKFDRKNYFYPDLPKGYQISQYDLPFVSGGELSGVAITRVHLEEDTGRLIHETDNTKHEAEEGGSDVTRTRLHDSSLVDFNRAGVPLMELVTEPVIHDAETALRFAKELQLVLRYLGVSDADMEKGQMRVEANISVSTDPGKFGTKVEVKNLNSFRAVEGAIRYEIKRQSELLDEGGKVVQETRGWNEGKKKTFSQRLKESAHDYRYFPEPDIPPIDLSQLDLMRIKTEVPELPEAKRRRLRTEYGLSPERAEPLVAEPELAAYFEKSFSELLAMLEELGATERSDDLLFNYLTSDLKGLMNQAGVSFSGLKFAPENFAHLVFLVKAGTVGSRAAKDIMKKMFDTGLDPEEILKQEGLAQVSDEGELLDTVRAVIAENSGPVADYRAGKANVLQFLIGKAMGSLRGRGNPAVIKELLEKFLK